MAETTDIVIIGAGIIGAAIAAHLAARGHSDVIVLEQAPQAVSGASARSAGGVRHQFSAAVNIRLSQLSVAKLDRFADEYDVDPGWRRSGYLLLFDDPAAWDAAQANVARQRTLGARVETLSPDAVAGHVPGTRLDDLVGATFGPDDGVCDPHTIAMAYLRRAQDRGVQLRRATPVTAIHTDGAAVTGVTTAAGTIGCGVVVNAAGAWAGDVARLAGLPSPVRPFRRGIYLTGPVSQVPRHAPMTIDIGSGFQFRPEMDRLLFGGAHPHEPSSFNTDVDWAYLDTLLDQGLHRFPFLAAAGVDRAKCWAGLYAVTPDHMPILGRHPARAGYVDANGFSGHGVMHAPATGQLMAEEILDGRAHTIDIDELRVARFDRETSGPERVVF